MELGEEFVVGGLVDFLEVSVLSYILIGTSSELRGLTSEFMCKVLVEEFAFLEVTLALFVGGFGDEAVGHGDAVVYRVECRADGGCALGSCGEERRECRGLGFLDGMRRECMDRSDAMRPEGPSVDVLMVERAQEREGGVGVLLC